ncbi:MAG: hypothetical protein LBS20_05165 [Prevotella sp.]|nr:hypothetical protein [Prevotella sp.]
MQSTGQVPEVDKGSLSSGHVPVGAANGSRMGQRLSDGIRGEVLQQVTATINEYRSSRSRQ